MTKPKWTEVYNCHQLRLSNGAIEINVNWDCLSPKETAGGYKISCNDLMLKNKIQDLKEAKAEGIRLARKVLNVANEQLAALEAECRDKS